MRFTVMGGDERMCWLRRRLTEDGHKLVYRTAEAEAVILPMPLTQDGLTVNGTDIVIADLLRRLPKGIPVLGGGHAEGIMDYSADEALMRLNAVPTAEGAVAIAINNMPGTLWCSRAVVAGAGRVGMTLAARLRDMGARVTVTARSAADEAAVRALSVGYCPTCRIDGVIKDADVVFNTVPRPVIGGNALSKMKKDSIIIELASRPGGVDREAAEELDIRIIDAPGLPGRTAPRTAGEIICETIYRMLGIVEGTGC